MDRSELPGAGGRVHRPARGVPEHAASRARIRHRRRHARRRCSGSQTRGRRSPSCSRRHADERAVPDRGRGGAGSVARSERAAAHRRLPPGRRGHLAVAGSPRGPPATGARGDDLAGLVPAVSGLRRPGRTLAARQHHGVRDRHLVDALAGTELVAAHPTDQECALHRALGLRRAGGDRHDSARRDRTGDSGRRALVSPGHGLRRSASDDGGPGLHQLLLTLAGTLGDGGRHRHRPVPGVEGTFS